jgi:hypothetical protein
LKVRSLCFGKLLESSNLTSAVGRLRISEKDLDRIGKPKTAVRLPEYAGGGYIGGIDVFHQIALSCTLRLNSPISTVNLISEYA